MVHRQESVAIEAANRGGGPDGGYTLSESIRTDAQASDTDKRKRNSGVVDVDAKKPKRCSEPYAHKSIRNGIDEYKWWMEEAIGDGTVDILRGGQVVREKAVRPTGKLILELWIRQFADGDSKGLNLVPVQNGKSRQLIRKEET